MYHPQVAFRAVCYLVCDMDKQQQKADRERGVEILFRRMSSLKELVMVHIITSLMISNTNNIIKNLLIYTSIYVLNL